DESGRVLWQRERLGPRIGTIAELLQTRDVSDKLMPWEIPMTPWKPAAGKFEMPSSATTSTVIQNGSVNLLITQPVKVMTGAGEDVLRSLANGIERNLTEDVRRFLRLTTLIMRDAPRIRTNLKECATLIAGMPPKRCDAWSALANGMLAASPAMSPGFAELDV